MIKNALNIKPEWIEVESPNPQGLPLQQTIADAFYQFGERQGYLFLPNIAGLLSTTFSHPVFAMPHLNIPTSLHGFHEAFRPTDNDEGTHLVAFGQYYICTNIPLTNQFEFIRQIFFEVIKATCPSDVGHIDIKLEEGLYEWQADSTGYKGGGSEVNVTSITLDGKEYKIGRLELAQINDYAVSGNIQGNPCHLIVFGIDRLVNLYAIAKTIKDLGKDAVPSMSIEDLYWMGDEEAGLHKGLIDAFRSTPTNSKAILSSLSAELHNIGMALKNGEISHDIFSRLGQVSSLAECAYASNAITRNYRQYLIRKLGQLYNQFSKHIAAHPQTHWEIIRQSVIHRTRDYVATPSVRDVIEQPYFKDHFSVVSRVSERKTHNDLVPQELIDFFVEEEIIGGIKLHPARLEELKEQSLKSGPRDALEILIKNEQRRIFSESGNELNELPQLLLKRQMFYRAVGEDLAQPIESLAQPTDYVVTLAGSIAERIIRIGMLLDFLKGEGMLNDIAINYQTLKDQRRYLAVEWQYRSTKIYPQLEGSIGAVAMQQQGCERSLIERIRAFHLAGTKRQDDLRDPDTLLLVLVGKLDEAVSLYTRSIEDGRSISSLDPFGVKTKITTAINAAKALYLDEKDLRALLTKITEINPDAIGDEQVILKGYFWSRIEKGLSDIKKI